MQTRPMHYWNRDNFKGLLSVADALAKHEHYNFFADYCRLREKGLRKEALQKLEQFIQHIKSLSPLEQRNIVDELLSTQFYNQRINQLLPQPLFTKLIEPVLESWHAAASNDATALRWLGVYKNNPALLKEALAIDSIDIISRTQLAKFHLNQVDYATHHLVESLFIGSEAESLEDLAEAKKLIADIQHEASRQHYAEWHLELSSLVNDWLEYKQKPEGKFPEWCKKNGKSYKWPTIVYYDE